MFTIKVQNILEPHCLSVTPPSVDVMLVTIGGVPFTMHVKYPLHHGKSRKIPIRVDCHLVGGGGGT